MKFSTLFDHSYTRDDRHSFLKKLERYGFKVNHDYEVEHPGKHFCKFIHFENYNYLEFIKVPKSGKEIKTPGLSFKTKDLKCFFEKIKKQSTFKCQFLHKNYNWKENNIDTLPGWNFLSFANTGIRSFYPWFTEYEQIPRKKKKTIKKFNPAHPNMVNNIHGLEIYVNEKGEKFFEKILGMKIKEEVILSNGFKIYFHKKSRSNKLSNIILESSNLETTKKYMPKEKNTIFRGSKGIVINNPCLNNKMWNIIII